MKRTLIATVAAVAMLLVSPTAADHWCAGETNATGVVCRTGTECCGGSLDPLCIDPKTTKCCSHYSATGGCPLTSNCCGGNGPGASSYVTCCKPTASCCNPIGDGLGICCDAGSTCCGSYNPVCCPTGSKCDDANVGCKVIPTPVPSVAPRPQPGERLWETPRTTHPGGVGVSDGTVVFLNDGGTVAFVEMVGKYSTGVALRRTNDGTRVASIKSHMPNGIYGLTTAAGLVIVSTPTLVAFDDTGRFAWESPNAIKLVGSAGRRLLIAQDRSQSLVFVDGATGAIAGTFPIPGVGPSVLATAASLDSDHVAVAIAKDGVQVFVFEMTRAGNVTMSFSRTIAIAATPLTDVTLTFSPAGKNGKAAHFLAVRAAGSGVVFTLPTGHALPVPAGEIGFLRPVTSRSVVFSEKLNMTSNGTWSIVHAVSRMSLSGEILWNTTTTTTTPSSPGSEVCTFNSALQSTAVIVAGARSMLLCPNHNGDKINAVLVRDGSVSSTTPTNGEFVKGAPAGTAAVLGPRGGSDKRVVQIDGADGVIVARLHNMGQVLGAAISGDIAVVVNEGFAGAMLLGVPN